MPRGLPSLMQFVFCLLKLYMILTLTEFLQFFYRTHHVLYF